jgi:signal transduction histidine kinase
METVSVLIADNGPGIAPEHRENIFKPFFTTKTRGTGLGLWLTRRIVEEHGGSIRVRSRVLPGQSGTVFQVCLPSSPAQQVKLSSDPEMSGQAA